jgi:hypothetical protein
MAKKGYLDEDDFYYEIVLSKGKGLLTKKAERMLILIGNNMIIKLRSRYTKNPDDENDCLQSGLLSLFLNWNSFNDKRFKVALPYFSEIFKRGAADGYNKLLNKKSNQDGISTISLDSCNDGEGFFNI